MCQELYYFSKLEHAIHAVHNVDSSNAHLFTYKYLQNGQRTEAYYIIIEQAPTMLYYVHSST